MVKNRQIKYRLLIKCSFCIAEWEGGKRDEGNLWEKHISEYGQKATFRQLSPFLHIQSFPTQNLFSSSISSLLPGYPRVKARPCAFCSSMLKRIGGCIYNLHSQVSTHTRPHRCGACVIVSIHTHTHCKNCRRFLRLFTATNTNTNKCTVNVKHI